jgi:magnesium-transporting ATPase (P-type)/class 3 adenylate cyclase
MRHKDSSITRKIFWYSVSAVIINLVFSLISTMILMIKATGVDIIEKLDPHVRDGLKFFSFIILYSPIQPLFVITICNIINMLQAIILEKKYSAYSYTNSKLYKKQGRFNLGEERHNMDEDANFSTVLQHKNLLVLNPYILPNLGCVEDVFFDKTGTLALTRFEVQSFATAKKHYKSSTENFRIGGITNVKADNFNEDGNDSERSFEGFDSMMFLDNNKTRDADDDFQVYDFGARKMLPNPFNEGKLNSSLQSQNDLAALENPTEDKTTLNNEKFLQTSNPVRRADRRFSFVQGAAQKLMDDLEKPYDEVEFMTDTKTDKDLKYILQMFTVCHNAKVKGDEYQTHSAEERCLLKFAEQFNYACLSAIPNTGYETDEDIHQKVYEVKRQDGVAQKYYVYIINEGKTKNDRFSILAQDTSSRTFWMFVKGSTECMENLIDFGSSTNNYKKAIKFNKESGLHSIVFARKQITEADVLKTVADYKKIIQTSLDVETDLSTLMGKLESNLKFSAVVGVKTSMREDAAATVDLMKSMGLNVHILTGDSFENAVNTATYLKLLPLSDQQPYTVLDFEDVSDGNVKIREVLDKMKVVMSNKKRTGGTELDLEKVNRDVPAGLRRSTTQVESSNFFSHSFVFSGRTIEVITSSKYLYTHFAFILQFASSIVGYDMKPMHKGYLINLMKEAHRSKIIMTVGDGFNDIPMMYNSDISVQITTENTQLGYGDIVTKDLAIIPEIMLLEGVKFNSNLNLSVMGSFFNSILVACILFFFQFYCAFTSTAIIQSGLIYATYAAYSALALIFIIYESVYPELLRCELPALYIESYYFNKMKLSKFMVLFLGAMISAVVIFYPAMYYMTTEITPSGIPMNSNNFTLHLIMCSHFATVLRFMFITRRGMFMIVAVAIDIAAFALVWVGIIFVNVNNSIYEVAILELLENMNSLIGFFASIMVSFIIDWALWETYHLSRLFPIFIYMKINSRKKISIDSSRALNKQLLTSFHSHPELSRTVRNCFGINDEIDLVIESILGKSSNREVEISSKTLSIESSKLRKKYGIYIVKKFLTNLRVQFGIGFLCILIFSIITAVIQRKIDQIFFVNFGITVCVFSIFMITISRAFEVNLEQFAWLITPSFAVIGAFNSLVREADHSLLSVVIVIFTITNYSIDFRMVSLMILLQFIWYCFSYLLIYDKLGSYMWTFDMDNKQAQVYAIASLVCTVFLIKITAIVQRYRIEKLIKREFIAGSVLQSKSNLTTDLLKLLLPTFVLDQMKSFDIQDKTIGDDAGEVTILFCDIADFDKVIKLKEKDIVKILDNIFRRFDELCKENGCQKIETVGKTYMACGGLKYVEQTISKELRDINPTARILDLAKQMMFEIKNYEDLTLKIGIHRGKCMMGVIGYHKPQFSLIGDVVNTTSRHCTTGEKGHIMVSHDAWGQLTQTNVKSKGYTFLEVETEMKGKGLVPVYHLMPFQGLVRKKLEEIIERYKREKKPMPEALKKIEQVLSNSRHELRRKMINSKINLLLRNVIENAKKEMKQDLLEESQMAEVNQIPARGQNRKKTIGAGAARTSKRMSTKLNIQNNARQVEPFENVESSDSEEDEDAGEVSCFLK